MLDQGKDAFVDRTGPGEELSEGKDIARNGAGGGRDQLQTALNELRGWKASGDSVSSGLDGQISWR